MIERNDQGKDIEITSPLHSREWCEQIKGDVADVIDTCNNITSMIKFASKYGKCSSPPDASTHVADLLAGCIHPNSEEFDGIMAGCSEEFREAVRGKMNG